MSDRERITELLGCERRLCAGYDACASECANIPLRDEFLKLFSQSHHTQTELFQAAQVRGWYRLEQAPEEEIDRVYQQFLAEKPE